MAHTSTSLEDPVAANVAVGGEVPPGAGTKPMALGWGHSPKERFNPEHGRMASAGKDE